MKINPVNYKQALAGYAINESCTPFFKYIAGYAINESHTPFLK
jgi:hypothetical protein